MIYFVNRQNNEVSTIYFIGDRRSFCSYTPMYDSMSFPFTFFTKTTMKIIMKEKNTNPKSQYISWKAYARDWVKATDWVMRCWMFFILNSKFIDLTARDNLWNEKKISFYKPQYELSMLNQRNCEIVEQE